MNAILEALASARMPNVFNPWTDHDPLDLPHCGPADRAMRLVQHFDCPGARLLLIGEAPGYQGCHFSGVPFTNEALICGGGVPRIASDRFTSRPKPWSEPSATIVWGALHQHNIADQVVMWNAFAWHPHKSDELHSNRAPTRAEQEAGMPVLRLVLEHFKGMPVVPIGRVSEASLRRLGVTTLDPLRHPAMGGANEFRAGLAALVRGHGSE